LGPSFGTPSEAESFVDSLVWKIKIDSTILKSGLKLPSGFFPVKKILKPSEKWLDTQTPMLGGKAFSRGTDLWNPAVPGTSGNVSPPISPSNDDPGSTPTIPLARRRYRHGTRSNAESPMAATE
jgi:hypothetical protein